MADFLLLLKPDAVRRGLISKILAIFEERGYIFKNMRMRIPDGDILKEHYAEHIKKPFFDGMVEFMTSGHVLVVHTFGDIELARTIVGNTKQSE